MNNRKIRKFIKWLLFLIYIAALVYFMFFAEMLGRDAGSTYRYNLVPLKEIKRFMNNYRHLGLEAVLANIAGNIIAFMPFGFCIPLITDHRKKFIATMFFSFAMSLMIELIQLVSKVGCFDVDDLTLNTIGGIFGYIVYDIYIAYKRKHGKIS